MASAFQLLRPTTVAEATAELDHLGDQAKVYAGGAELLLLMRNGVVEPAYLVDIKHVVGFDEIAWDGNVLRIGPTASHRRLENDRIVQELFPTFAESESHIGNVRVRNQGTLGGNLCFADPHADPGTALLLHDTVVAIAGPSSERELPLEEFMLGTYEIALAPNELLTRIDVRPLPPDWKSTFLRIERYYRPTVNVAAAARRSGPPIDAVRLIVGCIGPRPTRLVELEEELRGATAAEADARLAAASAYLAERLDPVDDLLGSAAYKLHLAVALLRHAVADVASTNDADGARR